MNTTTQSTDQQRRAFFDAHGQGWEARNYSDAHYAKLQKMVDAFALTPGSSVLDVGCGEGVLYPFLHEAVGPAGRLIALDPSPVMLRGAVQKNYTTVLLAAAEAIPLPDAYIDTVICFAAYPHCSDKVKAASEFFRVLRPGGRAFVAHLMDRAALAAHHAQHHAVAGDHLPCPVGMNKIFSGAGFATTHLDEAPGWYLFTAYKE